MIHNEVADGSLSAPLYKHDTCHQMSGAVFLHLRHLLDWNMHESHLVDVWGTHYFWKVGINVYLIHFIPKLDHKSNSAHFMPTFVADAELVQFFFKVIILSLHSIAWTSLPLHPLKFCTFLGILSTPSCFWRVKTFVDLNARSCILLRCKTVLLSLTLWAAPGSYRHLEEEWAQCSLLVSPRYRWPIYIYIYIYIYIHRHVHR